MDCYETAPWRTTDDPWFPSVARAYILLLHGSARSSAPTFNELGVLSRATYLQTNRDWQTCAKVDAVYNTATDLVDAYRQACEHCAGVEGPVLILEDDAQIFSRDRTRYAEVDAFVRDSVFDVYSLGSFGGFDAKLGNHRHFKKTMGFTQAVIWSKRARDHFLARLGSAKDVHIDVHTISSMPLKYTYKQPLVVQTFPTTPNMANWCIRCDGSRTERVVVRAWIWFLQRPLRLDASPRRWRTLYWINENMRALAYAPAVIVAVVCALVARRVLRK